MNKSKEYKEALALLKRSSREQPASRQMLMIATGLSDREVRKLIHRMRMDGLRICSDSHSSGYWKAKTQKDYEAFRKQFTSYAREIQKAARAMDK